MSTSKWCLDFFYVSDTEFILFIEVDSNLDSYGEHNVFANLIKALGMQGVQISRRR